MVGDASGHGGRHCAPAVAQTRVRCAEIIDGADQVHPVLQGQRTACQRPAAARQHCQALPERRVEPFDVGRVDHPLPLRPAQERRHACRCTGNDPMLDSDDTPLRIALHDLGDEEVIPGPQPRTPLRSRALRITKRLANRPAIGDKPVSTAQEWAVYSTATHPLHEATNQGQVTVGADLTRQPQAGTDHHRQGHPHNAPLGLDADLVGLHLLQVTRLLNQMLLYGLPLDTRACRPARYGPFVETKGDDDRLQWTAMGEERDHEGHRRRRGPQAVQRRAFRRGERFAARRAEEPRVLARVDTNSALACLSSGRALQFGQKTLAGSMIVLLALRGNTPRGVCLVPVFMTSQLHHGLVRSYPLACKINWRRHA